MNTDLEEIYPGIGNMPLNPFILRRVFLDFTRMIFSDPENYGSMKGFMKNHRWHVDRTVRTMDIRLLNISKDDKASYAPGLFVEVGDSVFQDTAIDNRVEENLADGSTVRVMLERTPLSFQAVAGNADEALALSTVLLEAMLLMRDLWGCAHPSFHNMKPVKHTKPSRRPLDREKPEWISTAEFLFVYEMAYAVHLESHRLKAVSWDIIQLEE